MYFACLSGTLRVTDPTFEVDQCPQYVVVIPRAAVGRWQAHVVTEEDDLYVACLYVMHTELSAFWNADSRAIHESPKWQEVGEVGVDSAHVGVMDDALYHGPDQWALACGVVCPSGYGDGVYPVEVYRNSQGQLVGVRIEFIDE